jgi:hypothetical protein
MDVRLKQIKRATECKQRQQLYNCRKENMKAKKDGSTALRQV